MVFGLLCPGLGATPLSVLPIGDEVTFAEHAASIDAEGALVAVGAPTYDFDAEEASNNELVRDRYSGALTANLRDAGINIGMALGQTLYENALTGDILDNPKEVAGGFVLDAVIDVGLAFAFTSLESEFFDVGPPNVDHNNVGVVYRFVVAEGDTFFQGAWNAWADAVAMGNLRSRDQPYAHQPNHFELGTKVVLHGGRLTASAPGWATNTFKGQQVGPDYVGLILQASTNLPHPLLSTAFKVGSWIHESSKKGLERDYNSPHHHGSLMSFNALQDQRSSDSEVVNYTSGSQAQWLGQAFAIDGNRAIVSASAWRFVDGRNKGAGPPTRGHAGFHRFNFVDGQWKYADTPWDLFVFKSTAEMEANASYIADSVREVEILGDDVYFIADGTNGRDQALYRLEDRMVANHEVVPVKILSFSNGVVSSEPSLRVGGGRAGVPRYMVAAVPSSYEGAGGAFIFDAAGNRMQTLRPAGDVNFGEGLAVVNDLIAVSQSGNTRKQVYLYRYQGSLSNWVLERTISMADLAMSEVQKFGDHLALTPEFIAIASQLDGTRGSLRTAGLGRRLEADITLEKYDFGLVADPQLIFDLESRYSVPPPASFGQTTGYYRISRAEGQLLRIPLNRSLEGDGSISATVSFNYRATYRRDTGSPFAATKTPPEPAFRLHYKVVNDSGGVTDVVSSWTVPVGTPRGDHSPEEAISNRAYFASVTTSGLAGAVVEAFIEFRQQSGTQFTYNNRVPHDSDAMDSVEVAFPSSVPSFTLNENGEQIEFAMAAGYYQLLLADGGRALSDTINLVDRFVDVRTVTAAGPYSASGQLTAPDWGDAGVSGIVVKARSAGGHELTATSDANGRFTINGLWPGMTYTFEPQVITQVTKSPALVTRTVSSMTGDLAGLDFQLSSNLALDVQTETSSGRGLSPVSVYLTAPHLGGAELSGESDANGTVRFVGLLPGSHSLRAAAYRWPLLDGQSLVTQFEQNNVNLLLGASSLSHLFILRTGELDFRPTDLAGPTPVDGAVFRLAASNPNKISGSAAAEKVAHRVSSSLSWRPITGNYSESKIFLPGGKYPGDFTLTIHGNALPTTFPLPSGVFTGSREDWLNYMVEITRPDGVSWSGKLFTDNGAIGRFSPNGRLIQFEIDGSSSFVDGAYIREEHWRIRLPDEIKPDDEFEAGTWTVVIRNPDVAIQSEMVDFNTWGRGLPIMIRVGEYVSETVNPTRMTLELQTDVAAASGARVRLNESDRLPSGNFELPLDFGYTLVQAPSKYVISSPVTAVTLNASGATLLAPTFQRQNEIEVKLLAGSDWGANPFPADIYIERSDGRWGYLTVYDLNRLRLELIDLNSGAVKGSVDRFLSSYPNSRLWPDLMNFNQVLSGDYSLQLAQNALGSGVYGGRDYTISYDTSRLLGVSADMTGADWLEVTVDPAGLAEVTISDANGQPVEGVALQFIPNPGETQRLGRLLPGVLPDPLVTTDASGLARHSKLFPRSYILTGAAPDFRLEPTEIVINGQDLPAAVSMTAHPLRAEGTLLDFNGDPLANADLVFRDADHDDVRATTDANGDFVIDGMPGGFFDIYLVTPGAGSTLLESGFEFHGNAIRPFTPSLEALNISGRLLAENPDFLYAGVSGDLLANGSVLTSFTTDEDGRFEVGGLFPGNYTLEVRNGDLILNESISLFEDLDIGDRVMAADRVQLSGRVTESVSGLAISEASIRLSSLVDESPEFLPRRSVVAPRLDFNVIPWSVAPSDSFVQTVSFDFGATGEDRVNQVLGTISVRAQTGWVRNWPGDNTTPFTFDLIAPDGRTVSGDLEIPAISNFKTSVFTLDLSDLDLSAFHGTPIAGVWQMTIATNSTMVGNVDAVLTVEREEATRYAVTATDANGDWTASLPAGTITATAEQSGWGFTPFRRELAASSDEDNLDFAGIISRVSGTLSLRGSGLPGISVEMTGPNAYRETAISDEDGRYTFGGVPAGLYQISLSSPLPQYQFANPVFAVPVDELVEEVPDRSAITSELVLNFDTPFEPVPNVAVELIGPESLTGVSDSSGQLVFPSVLPGSYRTSAGVTQHRVNIPGQITMGQSDRQVAVAVDRLSDVTVPVAFTDGFGAPFTLRVARLVDGLITSTAPVALTQVGADGVGLLRALDDGQYLLQFDRGYDFSVNTREFTVNNGDLTLDEVTARVWKDLVLEVTNRGHPVAGVSVELVQRDLPGRKLELQASTDAQGRVVLPAAPPDLYDYTILHPYIQSLSGVLTHGIEGPVQSFAVTALAEVSGTVTRRDRDGRPAVGVRVEIDGIADITDGFGNYQITGLLDGALPLSVEREGYTVVDARDAITINAYQTTRSFEVEGQLSFAANFVDADAAPLDNLGIEVREQALGLQSTRTLQTDNGGNLVLTDLGPDDYLYFDFSDSADLPDGQYLFGAGERYIPARGEVGANFSLAHYAPRAPAITEVRSSRVELSSIPAILADTGEVTIEFWARPSGNQAALFYAEGENVTQGFYAVVKQGTALRYPLDNNTSQTDDVFPSAENWYHVAISYQADNAQRDATVYVNGQVVAFAQFEGAFTAAGAVDYIVGGSGVLVDEVRVWNIALKASELHANLGSFDVTEDQRPEALVEYHPIAGGAADRRYLHNLRTPSQTPIEFVVPLGNDSGQTPVLSAESRPLEGAVERVAPDRLRFTPRPDFVGDATITYTLENEYGRVTEPRTVQLTVAGLMGSLSGAGLSDNGSELSIGAGRDARLSLQLAESWFAESNGELRISTDIAGLAVPGSITIRPGQSSLSIPLNFPAIRRSPVLGSIILDLGAQRRDISVNLKQTVWEADIKVVDAARNPIRGATAVLDGVSRQTDADGSVRFANLFEGDYRLELSAEGYDLLQEDRYSFRFSAIQPERAHSEILRFSESRPDFNKTFVARNYSQVAGRLTGVDAAVLGDVIITLENVETGAGATLGEIASDGSFGFTGLAPGDYKVSVVADGYIVNPPSVVATASTMPINALAVEATGTNPPSFTMVASPALDRISGPARTYGFSYYEVIPTSADNFIKHSDVLLIAEGIGARLGVFKSPTEQAAAYGAISAQDGVVYVGATFDATTADWHWLDNAPVGVIDWKDGFFSTDTFWDGAFVFPDGQWGNIPNDSDILYGDGVGGFLAEWPLESAAFIHLGGPVNADTMITLASSHPELVSVPARIVVPAGRDQVEFQIHGRPVEVPTVVTITASVGASSVEHTMQHNPPAFVSGTVATADGQPIPGVLIEARDASGVFVYSARSEADGHYTIPNAQPHYELSVSATRSGFVFESVDSDTTRNAAQADGTFATQTNQFASGILPINQTGLDFTGTSQLAISGQLEVELPSGRRIPAAGVSVTAGGLSTTSASDGSYQISGLLPGDYAVVAAIDGVAWAPASQSVQLDEQSVTVDFVGSGSMSISGRLLDSAGSPMAGETIDLVWRDRQIPRSMGSQTTDSGGAYSFGGLLPTTILGGVYQVGIDVSNVDLPDAIRAQLAGIGLVSADANLPDVTLSARTIEGHILEPDGSPASGVAVQASGSTYSGAAVSLSATTDANGAYVISGVPHGVTLQVAPAAAGFAFDPIRQAVDWSDMDRARLQTGIARVIRDFTLATGLSGQILDGNGVGVPGAQLALSGQTTTGATRSLSTQTDGNGRYSFDVEPGNYTITPTSGAATFTPADRSITLSGALAADIDFQISGWTGVEGRVTRLGQPLEGITVTATSRASPIQDFLFFSGQTSSTLDFSSARTYQATSAQSGDLSALRLSLSFRLEAADSGLAFTADLTAPDGTVYRVFNNATGIFSKFPAGTQGQLFLIADAGNNSVLADAMEESVQGVWTLRVATNSSAQIYIQSMSLSYTVEPELTVLASTQTGPDGRYALPIATGSYFMQASSADLVVNETNPTVIVGTGPLAQQDFTMSRSLQVTGTVERNGSPLAGATLALNGEEIDGSQLGPVTVQTDANGNYLFDGLEAGDYSVSVSAGKTYFASGTQEIQLIDADVTATTFAGEETFSIRGSVNQSQFPWQNLQIFAQPGSHSTLTDFSGNYTFADLPPGNYTVTPVNATANNLYPRSQTVLLDASDRTAVNFAQPKTNTREMTRHLLFSGESGNSALVLPGLTGSGRRDTPSAPPPAMTLAADLYYESASDTVPLFFFTNANAATSSQSSGTWFSLELNRANGEVHFKQGGITYYSEASPYIFEDFSQVVMTLRPREWSRIQLDGSGSRVNIGGATEIMYIFFSNGGNQTATLRRSFAYPLDYSFGVFGQSPLRSETFAGRVDNIVLDTSGSFSSDILTITEVYYDFEAVDELTVPDASGSADQPGRLTGFQGLSVASGDKVVVELDEARAGVSLQLGAERFDQNAITFEISSQPARGSLRQFDAATGEVTYAYTQASPANDSFTFQVLDNAGRASPPRTISIDVIANRVEPVVEWSEPDAIVFGSALSSAELSASARVPARFAYSPDLGEQLPVGTHPLSVRVVPDDTRIFKPVVVQRTITVTPQAPVITWNPGATIDFGLSFDSAWTAPTANTPGVFSSSLDWAQRYAPGTYEVDLEFNPDSVNYAAQVLSHSVEILPAASNVETWLSSYGLHTSVPIDEADYNGDGFAALGALVLGQSPLERLREADMPGWFKSESGSWMFRFKEERRSGYVTAVIEYTRDFQTWTREGVIYTIESSAPTHDWKLAEIPSRSANPGQPLVARLIYEYRDLNDMPVPSITGPSQGASFIAGDPVALSATATDADGDTTLGYLWEIFAADGSLADSGAGASYVATGLPPGTYDAHLTVTDSFGGQNAAPEIVSFTISSNQPPETTINSPAAGASMSESGSLIFSASATDPEGHLPLSFAWQVLDSSDGVVRTGSGSSYTVSGLSAGSYTARVVATDSLGATDSSYATRTFTVTANATPVISFTSPSSGTTYAAAVGQAIAFNVIASDPDGPAPSVTWYLGAGSDSVLQTGASYTRTFTSAGTYLIRARATDSLGAYAEASLSVTASASQPSITITSPTNNASFLEFDSVSLTAHVLNAPGGTVSWEEPINGFFGSGEQTSMILYSPGFTTITATLSFDGQTYTDTVDIEINSLGGGPGDPMDPGDGSFDDPYGGF